LQGSNDGTTWENIKAINYRNAQTVTDSLDSGARYKAFRVYNSSNSSEYLQTLTLQFYSASITDNSTAMSYIGLNNYCANTLLADTTWCNAICNSEYFESVLNVKVPVMTSNTTPEGVASAESILSANYPAWRAFDRTNNPWISGNGHINSWIGYAFTTEINLCMVA
jgi:hypothetical protein